MAEKILVLDDEPLILNTIQRALGKKGYDVRITGDIVEFMNVLRSDKPDLLIMDVNLGSIQSTSLLHEIERISPSSRILIISGAMQDLENRHFLEKPFMIEELRNKVRAILDAP